MANTDKKPLLTIYGCKVSKDGKKLVLTLVEGHDDDKTYYNACIKLDNTGKTHVKLDKDKKHYLIKVELLNDQPKKKQTKSKDADVETEDDGDIPF